MVSPTPNQSKALNIVVAGGNLNPTGLLPQDLIDIIKARSNDINGTTFVSSMVTDATGTRLLDAAGNDPIAVPPNTLVYASVTGVAYNITDTTPVVFNGVYAASRIGTATISAFTNVTGVSNSVAAIAPATGHGSVGWFASGTRQTIGITYTGVASKTIAVRAKVDYVFMPLETVQ